MQLYADTYYIHTHIYTDTYTSTVASSFQESSNLPGFLLVCWQIQECLRRQKEEVGKIIGVNRYLLSFSRPPLDNTHIVRFVICGRGLV